MVYCMTGVATSYIILELPHGKEITATYIGGESSFKASLIVLFEFVSDELVVQFTSPDSQYAWC